MNSDEKQLSLLLSPLSLRDSKAQGPGDVLRASIVVAKAVGNVLRSTYGPRGMDKLIRDAESNITVSNDGATILKLLPVRHPIAHILVDTCLAHDKAVGDGTTGVVLLAASLLDRAGTLLQQVHLQEVIHGYEDALDLILEQIQKLGKPSTQESLCNVASTSLNSKMLKPHSAFFVDLLQKILALVPKLEPANFRIVKVPGADLRNSYVCDGLMIPPTFTYAGAEQQAKFLSNPKILILDHEIEHKHQKEYAQVVIDNPMEYNEFIKAEWELVYERLERIVATGCNIVLNVQGTGDVATQYFAERGIVCVSRIDLASLTLLAKSTSAAIQRSLQFLPSAQDQAENENKTRFLRENNTQTQATSTSQSENNSTSNENFPSAQILGTCREYAVKTIGAQTYHTFSGCEGVATLVLRGGSTSLLGEAERSIIDAQHAMRAILGQQEIVPGGGATEMHLSSHIRQRAAECESGKRRMVLEAFAEALVDLPRTLAENCGFDSPKIIAELTHIHQHADVPNFECYGIDVRSGGVCDTLSGGVLEGMEAKSKAILAAVDAATMILSVDRLVMAPE
eukprot:Phypoly_transcript_03453.p1 GENE.Phypoly_transcript_03453~~Phypoly_transcript_03453.p1  ORF type:complete len:568 (+),score=83.13 Phypoly_transcript_03453:30-1733(+)